MNKYQEALNVYNHLLKQYGGFDELPKERDVLQELVDAIDGNSLGKSNIIDKDTTEYFCFNCGSWIGTTIKRSKDE